MCETTSILKETGEYKFLRQVKRYKISMKTRIALKEEH